MTSGLPTGPTNEALVCPWCGNSGRTYEAVMGQYVRTRCSCVGIPTERRWELAHIKDERLSPYHWRMVQKRKAQQS